MHMLEGRAQAPAICKTDCLPNDAAKAGLSGGHEGHQVPLITARKMPD